MKYLKSWTVSFNPHIWIKIGQSITNFGAKNGKPVNDQLVVAASKTKQKKFWEKEGNWWATCVRVKKGVVTHPAPARAHLSLICSSHGNWEESLVNGES